MKQALKISGLQKVYPNHVQALKGIDLTVSEGDFFGLLGPNGAGKSTTIGIVASLINKTSGSIDVFGYDLDTQRDLAKAQIGLVPQEFNFNVFEKVIDILTNQAGYYGIPLNTARKRAYHYLERLGIKEKAKDPARFLSGGMKRRLLIARGMIHEPKILILDEPTAGVDIELRRLLWAFLEDINQKGITIILTTHYLEEAEHLCRNVAIINHGEIVKNTSVKELISQLHRETLILDLSKPVYTAPTIPGFECELEDSQTVSVSYQRDVTINQLFAELSTQGYEIVSLRNKSNRLEELFLHLVSESNQTEKKNT